VVTVRTDQGDLVLDNLRSSVVSWQKTGYRWIMRKSERNPQFWVELHGGQVVRFMPHTAWTTNPRSRAPNRALSIDRTTPDDPTPSLSTNNQVPSAPSHSGRSDARG
jgi:hypothetical protein